MLVTHVALHLVCPYPYNLANKHLVTNLKLLNKEQPWKFSNDKEKKIWN